MADGDVRKVKMLRRSRATGGAVLLPGKTYTVSDNDFMDLVRCGKGEDPTGEIVVRRKKPRKTNHHKEHPGGEGESTQTLGTSRLKRKAKAKDDTPAK